LNNDTILLINESPATSSATLVALVAAGGAAVGVNAAIAGFSGIGGGVTSR